MEANEFIWAQKYRPNKIKDVILSEAIKEKFQKFVDEKNVPNLILYGPPGVGKTTVAKAMLNEMGADYIVVNGSLSGNIDTLRHTITKFASSVSFTGGRKYVILDEADYLNRNSIQPALRNFIEEYSANCGFIMTCNFKDRIIEPLRSRFTVIEFSIPKEDRQKIAAKFFQRICGILEKEGIEYSKKVVARFIEIHFPDWRKVINELQWYSSHGKIDEGIFTAAGSFDAFKELFKYLKDKDFKAIRSWLEENSDIESGMFYSTLYDELPKRLSSESSIASAILSLAQYQYQEAFVSNPSINRAAACVEIMGECVWN